MLDFTRIYVDVDDCWKTFEKILEKHLIEDGTRKRNREGNLSISEIMTILIAFQASGWLTFKSFYQYVLKYVNGGVKVYHLAEQKCTTGSIYSQDHPGCQIQS